MVFSSITFLFFFLPFTLGIYVITGSRLRNFVLLLTSLFFYAWGEGVYLLVMLASILVNYFCGRFIVQGALSSRKVFVCGILFNICTLAFFKYANFIADNVNLLCIPLNLPQISLGPVHLPIGISFFTFQAMSYLIDVYRKDIEPQHNPISLSLYIALFPQLIAGPIVRYGDIAKNLANRKLNVETFATGGQRFLMGLGKKVLIANPLAVVADQIFSLPGDELSTSVAWLGAICYTFQIYYDFSGYSDMAIGLGRMFGFRFPENFNYPYISRSIREFWRRWHISLSLWLRDYVYFPLGGNRKGASRTYLNLITVFLLCGLWHGASWTFILWGAYHGFFLCLERSRRLNVFWQKAWWPIQTIATFIIVIAGWVLFRSESISAAIDFLSIMFFPIHSTQGLSVDSYLNSKILVELTFAALLSLPIYSALARIPTTLASGNLKLQTWYTVTASVIQLSFFITLFYFTAISLAAGAYNPFIYFRF